MASCGPPHLAPAGVMDDAHIAPPPLMDECQPLFPPFDDSFLLAPPPPPSHEPCGSPLLPPAGLPLSLLLPHKDCATSSTVPSSCASSPSASRLAVNTSAIHKKHRASPPRRGPSAAVAVAALTAVTAATVATDTAAASPVVRPAVPPDEMSHTRRCREKVSRQFDQLVLALPPPALGADIKHKAQILQYTITVCRKLLRRRRQLRHRIVLSSPDALRSWLTGVVLAPPPASTASACTSAPATAAGADPHLQLSELVAMFARVYAIEHGWSLAETWAVNAASRTATLRASSVTEEDRSADAARLRKRLLQFRADSQPQAHGQGQPLRSSSPLARVIVTRRPEFHPALAEAPAPLFGRAPRAARAGLRAALVVPVVVRARVVAVLVLFDARSRDYSVTAVARLQELLAAVVDAHDEIGAVRSASSPQQQKQTPQQQQPQHQHQHNALAHMAAQKQVLTECAAHHPAATAAAALPPYTSPIPQPQPAPPSPSPPPPPPHHHLLQATTSHLYTTCTPAVDGNPLGSEPLLTMATAPSDCLASVHHGGLALDAHALTASNAMPVDGSQLHFGVLALR